MRGYGFPLGSVGRVYGFQSSIAKCHLENPFSLIGRQPPSFDLLSIIQCFCKWVVGEFPHVVLKAWVEYNF